MPEANTSLKSESAARGELRRLQEAAARQNREAALAEEIAGFGHWRFDVGARKTTWSAGLYRIYGIEPGADPSLAAILDMVHPDDRAQASLHAARAIATGEPYQSRVRITRPDGQLRITDGRTVCERGPDGRVVSLFGARVDVTEQVLAKAALAESEARFRELAETTSDVTFRVEMDDTITYASPSVRRYGWAPTDLVGTKRSSFIHPDDLARMARSRQAFTGSGRPPSPEDREFRVRTAAGDYCWMEGNPAIVHDAAGTPLAIISVMRDIQERKAAQAAMAESETRYRELAESASDVTFRVDMNDRVTYASPSARRYGWEPAEVVGRPRTDFTHPDDAERVSRAIHGLLAGGGPPSQEDREFRVLAKSGDYVWMEGSPAIVRGDDGAPVAIVSVMRDITERKAVQEELVRARAEAEAAAAVKSEFLANMSHELRTPLTSVLGFTRLALEQPDLSPVTRAQITRAANAGASLLTTVNDILDFSKLEAGQLEIRPRPNDPARVCAETLELFSGRAAEKGLTLVFAPDGLPDCLEFDADRLRQLLLNLVGNAMKFSDAGQVVLAASWRPDERRLRLSVTDNGPGIPADQQARLFKRFSQVDGSSTRRHGGTGLGLAISMGLVEAMGGSIGVESAEGRGARFHFDLPAPLAVPDQTDVDGPPIAVIPGTRVLVVDDHPANRELVRAILTPLGAIVAEAANGAEGLSTAGAAPFDLILMDLRMPVLDGMGAMLAIRAGGGANALTPILAFSAGTDMGGAEARLAAGFNGDLGKPLLPADLVLAVAFQTSPWQFADATDARVA